MAGLLDAMSQRGASRMNPKEFMARVKSDTQYELIDWMLYDTLPIALGTQTLTFFQQTIGQTDRTRTNMKSAGQLTSPQTFLLETIDFEIYNINGEQLQTTAFINPLAVITSQGYFDLTVDPSVQYEGKLSDFQNINTNQTQVDSAAATLTTGNYIRKRLKLKLPIVLFPNRAFKITSTFTAPAAAGSGFDPTKTVMSFAFGGMLARNKG